MQDLTKKILEKLPSSWEELKFRDFIKLGGIEITQTDDFDGVTVGIENTIKVLSVLSNTSEDKIASLPKSDFEMLGKKIDFISIEPKPKKQGTYQWKKVEEMTYNDFITCTNSKQPLDIDILKTMSKDKLTEEQVLDMPMSEAVTAFFLLRKDVKSSVKAMLLSSRKQLGMIFLKGIWNRIRGRQKLQVMPQV